MKPGLKNQFMERWLRYFPNIELPIGFYYTDDIGEKKIFRTANEGLHCFIGDLSAVRHGQTLCFDAKSVACFGGKRYLGFSQNLMPNFEYFLSCGIPGKLEGERYKKTPELVTEFLKSAPAFTAPAKYIVFKRWDYVEEADPLQVVVFFATPDVLSGLFTLANFDDTSNEAVYCPMSAGCGTIIQYPLRECQLEHPRAVLGMFDVSARPCVDSNSLTFSVPMKMFEQMTDNMDESFFITESWNKVKARFGQS
jgi:hypothetical protein